MQKLMVRVSALDTTQCGLGEELETRVPTVARETSVLGTSAFEAPSFLHMETTDTAVLRVQRNVCLFSVQHLAELAQVS
jgi:hypothetical protein